MPSEQSEIQANISGLRRDVAQGGQDRETPTNMAMLIAMTAGLKRETPANTTILMAMMTGLK